MSKKDKELAEIVAEVLIEMHEHKLILEEHTKELHFQREQQERLFIQMENLNEKVDKNQASTEHVINTMFNVVLDKLDNITGELKTINTRLNVVEEKIDSKKN